MVLKVTHSRPAELGLNTWKIKQSDLCTVDQPECQHSPPTIPRGAALNLQRRRLLNRASAIHIAKTDLHLPGEGAGRSSEVERSLMVRWVVGSIPLSYFSFQPVLHDWCNKGRGMCYPVCGMVHIKEPLLLIDKSSLCGGSGFPFSLSEWSLTICLTPYNRR